MVSTRAWGVSCVSVCRVKFGYVVTREVECLFGDVGWRIGEVGCACEPRGVLRSRPHAHPPLVDAGAGADTPAARADRLARRSRGRASWHARLPRPRCQLERAADVADQTFRLMRGWPVDELRALIAEQIEPLAALAFPDAIQRMRAHQARGEQAIVVSASLADLVEPLAARLGLEQPSRRAPRPRTARTRGGSEHSSTGGQGRRRAAYAGRARDRPRSIERLHRLKLGHRAAGGRGAPYAVNPDRALEGGRATAGAALHRAASPLAEAEAALLLESKEVALPS